MQISYSYSPWLLPLFISTGILFLLLVFAYRKKKETQARTFLWLMASLLIWTICYTLGLASNELTGKVFWLYMKYFGSASAPIIWFIFSLQFTQNETVLTPKIKRLLLGFYLLTLGVVFTSSWQHWMWGSIWIEPGLLEEQVTHGWYFWFYVACSYFFILASAWLYISFLWKVPTIHKRQSVLMTLGGIIPLLGRVALDVYGLNLVPQLDEVILFFLISSLIFSVALFRYNVLSIIPIAYAQVFHGMQIGVIVLDPQKRVLELNPAAKNMTGIETSDFLGKPLTHLWQPANDLTIESEGVTDLALPNENDARYYQIRSTRIANHLDKLSGYILLLTDITQQKKDALALEVLAREDGLTGLLNRRTFMDLAANEHKRALRYKLNYAVILLDIDHFKLVNDTYGHQFGDNVLQKIANRCKANLRSVDLLGRYGGEEFIFLMPHITAEKAALAAEKIRLMIADTPIQPEKSNQSASVSASIGVAFFTPDDQEEDPLTLETVLFQADSMLYASKEKGRNCVSVWYK